MPQAERRALRTELLEIMEAGPARPPSEVELDRLALAVFEYQYRSNPHYAAYCRRRGRTPETVSRWSEIPAVPTAAFKEVPLVSGDPARPEAVFRTSGTTAGRERRGEHHVLDLSLYRASLLSTFRSFLLPDDARPRLLSLLPPVSDLPDSSLAYMVSVLVDTLGPDGSGWFASAATGLDHAELARAIRRSVEAEVPVLLLGTSFSFVHWLARLEQANQVFRLPAGSRLMDTGGYKGKNREVEPDAMWKAYEERLGLPPHRCVNEYGMTELSSQLYDTCLRDATTRSPAGQVSGPEEHRHPRRKDGPPWLRTSVVDPDTLEPLPEGEVGLLRHLDLANLDSVLAVQTEDMGRAVPGGIQLLGRVTEAPPRGCSIAMDDLLASLTDRNP